MMKNNEHTFVVMAYNTSDYLQECISALKNQTVSVNIIMTSSTPNEVQKKIAKFNNIKYIINTNRNGFAGDLNFAFSAAETKYVTLCHQDDRFEPKYLENMMKAADEYNNGLLFHTDYFEMRPQGKVDNTMNIMIKRLMIRLAYGFRNAIKSNWLKRMLVSFGQPICTGSVMYNKGKIGKPKYDARFVVSPEWAEYLRYTKINGTFVYIPKKLYGYRVHPGQITADGLENRRDEDREMFCRIWPRPLARFLAWIYSLTYLNLEK